MAPKLSPEEVKTRTLLFESVGLSAAKAAEVAKNAKLSNPFHGFVTAQQLGAEPLPSKKANLLLQIVVADPTLDAQKQAIATGAVLNDKIASNDQVSAAVAYLKANDAFDQKAFEAAAGVGIVVTRDQIQPIVDAYVLKNLDALKPAGWTTTGKTMAAVRSDPALRWANALDVKAEVEAAYLAHLGPRPDLAAMRAKAKESNASAPPAKAATGEEEDLLSETRIFEEGWLSRLHKPGENPQIDPKLMKQHLEFTKGKVFTRFPPEPNGYMHIGHLKALVINFGFAKFHNGHCYLRYDDTNPEAEEQIYIDAILEMVHWLGFEPFKVTYASDHFETLYECAKNLIRKGKAYVDHSTGEEMKLQRGGEERGARTASKWRDRPTEESLAEFEAMQSGKYKPGEAVLRMKQDLEDPNPQMWDLVAYRILDKPHHRTGTKWRVYPTYDFTHCLNDSFENISHSLCTIEFILSRQSYEWLCDELGVYKARQSEYGRLNIQGTVTSKRKIRALVDGHYVQGWDDPRMYTLIGLKRRGVPPGALKTFISQLGVSTTNTTIPLVRLEQTIRQYLEATTPRLMLVLDPLKVTIENLAEDYYTEVERPIHPRHPEMGSYKMPFTRTVYIERSDFREEDSSDFFRLAPGKRVGLLYVGKPIVCTSFRKDADGRVVEVLARYEEEAPANTKAKAYIHWVAEHQPSGSPVRVDEARLFKPLFTSENPGNSSDYLAELAPDSLQVVKGALVEVNLWKTVASGIAAAKKEAAGLGQAKVVGYESARFQGLRTAYFCLDNKDTVIQALEQGKEELGWTDGDRLVLNTIVGLKEDSTKKAAGV